MTTDEIGVLLTKFLLFNNLYDKTENSSTLITNDKKANLEIIKNRIFKIFEVCDHHSSP